jgi:hypothetical protein
MFRSTGIKTGNYPLYLGICSELNVKNYSTGDNINGIHPHVYCSGYSRRVVWVLQRVKRKER